MKHHPIHLHTLQDADRAQGVHQQMIAKPMQSVQENKLVNHHGLFSFITKLGLFFMLMLVGVNGVMGQNTVPAAFSLSGGNFSLTTYTGTSFPTNMAIGFASNSTDGTFNTDLTSDVSTNGTAAGNWNDEGDSGISYGGGGSSQRGSFLFRCVSTGRTTIQVGWVVRDISVQANTNYIELQWRSGASGTWNDVTGDIYEQGTTPNGTSFSVTLPSGAENQSDLRIRWIYYENGSNNRDRLAIDEITVSSSLAVSTPTITTDATPTLISTTAATLGGNVTATGGANITANGIAYALTATNSNPVIGGSGVTDLPNGSPGTGTGPFSLSTVAVLNVNAEYSYKAYATNISGTSYGSAVTFYTYANTPNTPTVNNPTSSTLDVTLGAGDGNPSTTQYAMQETTGGLYVQANGSLGASAIWQTEAIWSTKTVIGLAGGTAYTFQVRARNGANVETSFGPTASGMTTSALPPTITSPTVSGVTNNVATLGGNVSSDGGSGIIGRGVVWAETSLNNDPIIGGANTTDVNTGGTTGIFTVNATGLSVATQISYKAYATNSEGTSYTTVNTFYTLANEPLSQAANVTFNSIGASSFALSWTNGDGAKRAVFMREGGAGSITNPTDAATFAASTDWSAKGEQLGASGYYCIYNGTSNSVSMSNLTSGMIYYVQVFEYNDDGVPTAATTNYFIGSGAGNPGNTYALSNEALAHSATFSASPLTPTSIELSFDAATTISNAAGYLILQRAGAVAPTGFPADANGYSLGNSIGDGTVVAIITNTATTSATISGLSFATEYSYTLIPFNWNGNNTATYNYKIDGTVPSASATTSAASAPIVSTPTHTAVATTTATLGGNVTDDGGDPVTERGIVWAETSLNADPLIDGINVTKVTTSGTTGVFTIPVTSLPSGVSISYKAYAINSTGTGYTSIGTFTTLATQPTSAMAMTFSNTTVNSININWTNGTGTNRIVVARLNATTRVAPINATEYVVNTASFVDGTNATTGTGNIVVYNGNGSSVNVTGLLSLTTYAFDVYEYNGSGASSNYSTNLSGNKSTLNAEPVNQASNVTFTNISSTGFTINWTKGADADNSLVVIRSGSAVDADPVDGISYTATQASPFGTQIGTGNYVVYRASLGTIAITGLTEGVTYHVAVYSYKGNAGSGLENYLTTSPATGSQTAQTPTYYSKGSLSPSVLGNWSLTRDGLGAAPASFTTNAAFFVIQNGHTMTTTGTFSFGATGSKLQIENGGILSAGHAITIVSGATFQIDNGGTYIHNNAVAFATSIFNGTENFASGSNFEIQNYNTTGPSGVIFGNFTVNVTVDPGGSMQCSGNISQINGDFKLQNLAGGREIRLSASTALNLELGGDLIIEGGILEIASSNGSSTSRAITIGGSFNQSGGTIKCTGSNNPVTISFNGNGVTFTKSGGTLTNTNINWKINSSASITLESDFPVAMNRSLILNGGNITTSSYKVIMTSGASISRTSGHIAGNLQLGVVSGINSFPIGTSSVYAPVTIDMTGVSGTVDITGFVTSGNHPNEGTSPLDPTKKANHFWTMTKSGAGTFTSCTGVFDVSNTTNTGIVANYKVAKFEGAWSAAGGGATGDVVTSTSFTSFGDFIVGEESSCLNVALASATAGASPICSNATTTLMYSGLTGTDASVIWTQNADGTGTTYGTGSPSNPVGPGTYYAYATGTCGQAVVIQVVVGGNSTSLPTTVGTYTATFNHIDGASINYNDVSCRLLSRIEDASGGNELGSTTVNVVLTSAYPLTQTSNAQTFGGRKVTVSPASGGTATLTLYYAQSDFTFYNGGNGTLDVPSSGSNSDPNIGNLRIAQLTVGGNLDNFQAITPSSVNWNGIENRWEIVLNNVTLGSAGSDFYFYGPEVCNLTVENNSIMITNISETSANVSWDAVNGASGYAVRWRTGVDAWSTSVSFIPSKTLTFLNGGITYEVQVRAICNNGYGLASNSVGFTTLAPLPECSVPIGLSATGITSNGATIVWNAVSNSNVSYTIRWRVASPLGSWNQATTANTSRNLNPWLLSGTTYDIQVRTNCSNAQTNQSAWSSIAQFTTLASLPECSIPMGLSATGITSNGAMVVWNAVSNSNVSYTIRWRVASPLGSWSQATTAITSRNLNPWLLSGTTYDIQVRTNCSNAQTNQSAWSPIVQFSTNSQQGSQHPLKDDFYLLKESIASSIMEPMMSNSLTEGSIINSSIINNSDNINISYTHIYPNPTSDVLNLSFESGKVGDVQIRMMDVSGKIAKEMKFSTVEGSNMIQISLVDLSHGVYMIRVSADNTWIYTGRVIKIE